MQTGSALLLLEEHSTLREGTVEVRGANEMALPGTQHVAVSICTYYTIHTVYMSLSLYI